MSASARPHEHPTPIEFGSIKDSFKIIITSDLHIGAKTSRWDIFEEQILKPYAGDERVFILMNGDMINCIPPGDPRYRLSETHEMFKGTDNPPQLETAFYIDLLKKHKVKKSQFLGHTTGNHEDACLRFRTYDPFLDICRQLGSPFLGVHGYVRILTSIHGCRMPLVIYCHHGMGGGSRRKGSGAQLEKYINYAFPYRGADIYAFAHEHALADDAVVIKRPDWHHKGIRRKEVIYVNSGTYLGEEGYAMKKMFSPKPIGHIEITVTPRRKQVGRRRYHSLHLAVQKVSWQPIDVEDHLPVIPKDIEVPGSPG